MFKLISEEEAAKRAEEIIQEEKEKREQALKADEVKKQVERERFLEHFKTKFDLWYVRYLANLEHLPLEMNLGQPNNYGPYFERDIAQSLLRVIRAELKLKGLDVIDCHAREIINGHGFYQTTLLIDKIIEE